ncbi:tRNA lysidine(34) synthetase TilS [Polaribacter sp. Z014]|uniref:tRNA lysidine(34) synthetase TilS n=1 Tax=unclassified Polaribacter TaxID=196858 RepID=UPI00193B98A3|nr:MULTISPECIES: tRNA lysidine(34) synthetase TilS [unclassified Polaribacter]MCL7762352.1 tRNA lysidine(34) synthetase TilS [Polaribacter sp. Z014]QVY64224.1 tRNA lysidine(34) synthetase TilS [Polaribacter sp. Q13]
MQQKLSDHLNKNLPFLKDKKLLIAISGGIDSVVLAHLLSALNFNISLAHCNFNLRGKESDLDEEFVRELGKKQNINTFVTHFKTEEFAKENKQSTQIAARNLRYDWFNELIKKHQFDYILTAHHADDNLETFLINLTRGAGLDGLTGIPEINGNIVRPLLKFSRNDILTFVKENNISWREDKSNASTKYIRNKIRHQILPVLKEINPSLLETFAKTSEHLKESQQIIEDKIGEISNEITTTENNILKIDVSKVEKLSNPKAYLYQLLKDYNFTEWDDVSNLLSAQSGKQIHSKTHTLLKDRGFLLLAKKDFSTAPEMTTEINENTTLITQPIHLKLETVEEKSTENKQTIYVDKQRLQFPLKLRKWQDGDFFYPAGMTGKKKLSKYFKDEKFSLLQKQNTWLLCNNDNAIIWVVGHRKDKRFIVNQQTTTHFKISVF